MMALNAKAERRGGGDHSVSWWLSVWMAQVLLDIDPHDMHSDSLSLRLLFPTLTRLHSLAVEVLEVEHRPLFPIGARRQATISMLTEPIAYALCARVVLDSFPPTLAVYLSRGDRTRASEVDRMRTIMRWFLRACGLGSEAIRELESSISRPEELVDADSFSLRGHSMLLSLLMDLHSQNICSTDRLYDHIVEHFPTFTSDAADALDLDELLTVWLLAVMNMTQNVSQSLLHQGKHSFESLSSTWLDFSTNISDLETDVLDVLADGRILKALLFLYDGIDVDMEIGSDVHPDMVWEYFVAFTSTWTKQVHLPAFPISSITSGERFWREIQEVVYDHTLYSSISISILLTTHTVSMSSGSPSWSRADLRSPVRLFLAECFAAHFEECIPGQWLNQDSREFRSCSFASFDPSASIQLLHSQDIPQTFLSSYEIGDGFGDSRGQAPKWIMSLPDWNPQLTGISPCFHSQRSHEDSRTRPHSIDDPVNVDESNIHDFIRDVVSDSSSARTYDIDEHNPPLLSSSPPPSLPIPIPRRWEKIFPRNSSSVRSLRKSANAISLQPVDMSESVNSGLGNVRCTEISDSESDSDTEAGTFEHQFLSSTCFENENEDQAIFSGSVVGISSSRLETLPSSEHSEEFGGTDINDTNNHNNSIQKVDEASIHASISSDDSESPRFPDFDLYISSDEGGSDDLDLEAALWNEYDRLRTSVAQNHRDLQELVSSQVMASLRLSRSILYSEEPIATVQSVETSSPAKGGVKSVLLENILNLDQVFSSTLFENLESGPEENSNSVSVLQQQNAMLRLEFDRARRALLQEKEKLKEAWEWERRRIRTRAYQDLVHSMRGKKSGISESAVHEKNSFSSLKGESFYEDADAENLVEQPASSNLDIQDFAVGDLRLDTTISMSSVPFKPQESDISRSLVDNSVLSSVIGSETGDISFVSDLSASYDAKIQVKRDRFLARMRDRDQKRKKMHKGCTQNEILNSNLPAHPLSPATSIPSSPAQSVPSLSSPSDELVNGGYLLAAQTNESMVRNAIRYLCLPGQINSSLCLEVLEVLDAVSRQYSTSKVEIPLRFAVLVRGPSAPSYRALYCMDVENPSKLMKLHGRGPSEVSAGEIEVFLKYDSSKKQFVPLPLRSANHIGVRGIAADAISLLPKKMRLVKHS